MRTIYIDADYICHSDYADGRTAIETDCLDGVCDVALPCYKFVPAHDGKIDFCQCFDSAMATAMQSAYSAAEASMAALMERYHVKTEDTDE